MLLLPFLFLLIVPAWSVERVTSQLTFFSMGSKLYIEADRNEHFFSETSKNLTGLEESISTWKPQSRLSQFNQSSGEWISFDQDTYFALKKSLICSKATDGYFHPGLGQLIQLWGMRDQMKIPCKESVNAALKNADLSQIEFRDDGYLIRKKNRNFWFEEGGFAKGLALDKIIQHAPAASGKNLFLNFSGQIYSEKKKSVGIASPANRESIAFFVEMEKESVSTSGIGTQYFKHDNKIYGHILNPKTGFPVNHLFKSVTVIHPENFWADCLSTGLLVMSENKNDFRKWLKDHPEIKVILLEIHAGKISAETSCNLKNKIHINEQLSQINENC